MEIAQGFLTDDYFSIDVGVIKGYKSVLLDFRIKCYCGFCLPIFTKMESTFSERDVFNS